MQAFNRLDVRLEQFNTFIMVHVSKCDGRCPTRLDNNADCLTYTFGLLIPLSDIQLKGNTYELDIYIFFHFLYLQ